MNAEDAAITYAIHPSPFGFCLLAKTQKGLCALDLRDTEAELHDSLRMLQIKRKGRWQRDDAALKALCDLIFEQAQACLGKVVLDIEGTVFQKRVWKALLDIPSGKTVSYSDLAHIIGYPKAVRAVGSAVGDNPVGFLIPCHRVLRKDGSIGGYATGIHRKQAMLEAEARQCQKAA